ncbi:hypothetical protein ACH5RR_008092 [Cinchona calisaya]|uniref:Receptor-like serine/threonine-protein kinase n=1 Tax=Cinchona calisaya TaxID=153742 RepID=A0ABD3AAC8_9GENT
MAKKRTTIQLNLTLCCCFLFIDFCFSIIGTQKTDTIFQGQEFRDWEHLNSDNKVFRLQFFSPGNTKNRYLGIFYNLPPDVTPNDYDKRPVWVANRDSPIPDASGNLMIDTDGKFMISYGEGQEFVFFIAPARSNVSSRLLDNGNLVFQELNNSDGSVKQILWQSFDQPTDTLLPGMKLGLNFKTGQRWLLTSWISDQVPASGSVTFGVDPTNQLMIWWRGSVVWNSGIWQNGHFDYMQNLATASDQYGDLNFSYVSDEEKKYFIYSASEGQILTRYTLDSSGIVNDSTGSPTFGACTPHPAFVPGCNMEILSPCRRADLDREGDLLFDQTQGFPYGDSIVLDKNNYSLFDCRVECRSKCSCVAYASISDNGTGCEIWSNLQFEMTDFKQSREIFVIRRKPGIIGSWVGVAVGFTIFTAFWCLCIVMLRRIRAEANLGNKMREKRLLYELQRAAAPAIYKRAKSRDEKIGHELQVFSLESIELATNSFSNRNKLGEGGFGSVYKGELLDGRAVATKRLARTSGQGFQEFKNEILLIAKLQHTNLVKLLGCCIEDEEKILVYDYMTNKSLDLFLFDPHRKELLKWTNRLNIIEGVAQGLLYLHKYSRLRVIHRDLKASNILLDDNMTPKISDFGMARIFGAQVSEENTNRIVGTYGYMSPEYALNGVVSEKTDVFSFGVLLLEIISGKKNHRSYDSERPLNLIGLAWEMWSEGRALELVDPILEDSSHSKNEVMRCIHVGLLCVQDQAKDRPSMSDVVSMLTNDNLHLPAPKQPAFFIGLVATQEPEKEQEIKDPNLKKCSIKHLSISEMEPR